MQVTASHTGHNHCKSSLLSMINKPKLSASHTLTMDDIIIQREREVRNYCTDPAPYELRETKNYTVPIVIVCYYRSHTHAWHLVYCTTKSMVFHCYYYYLYKSKIRFTILILLSRTICCIYCEATELHIFVLHNNISILCKIYGFV